MCSLGLASMSNVKNCKTASFYPPLCAASGFQNKFARSVVTLPFSPFGSSLVGQGQCHFRAPLGLLLDRANGLEMQKALHVRAGMLEDVANTRIPTRDGREILAFVGRSEAVKEQTMPAVLLFHEFYGLTPEICGKAEALAKEVGCIVIAPDTYRGASTRFIPKAIFLALTTSQERVNEDLNEVLSWVSSIHQVDISRVGIVGFCYGGGKALTFSINYKRAKATVIIYGKPVLEVETLENIGGSVLGIFGDEDAQFPTRTVNMFREALNKAGVKNKVSIYEGQGHVFWRDMDQVKDNGPQKRAWVEVTTFLKEALSSGVVDNEVA